MNRITFLDYLRVFAIFMVLVVHACEQYYFGPDGGLLIKSAADAKWVIGVDAAARACVPLFVMTSAYLLFPVKGPAWDFLRRRLVKIGIPFLIWCAIYTWWNRGEWGALLFNFPMSAGGHLWFVPMLMGVYLVMPLLTPWAEKASKRELQLWLGVWLFTTTFPFLRKLLGYWLGAPTFGAIPYLYGECPWNAFGAFHYVSGFFGYLLLGFYFRKFLPEWTWRKTLSVAIPLGIVGWAIIAGGFYFRLGNYGSAFPLSAPYAAAVDLEMSWEYCSTGIAMTVFALFLVIRKFNSSGWGYLRLIRPLANASFGVYLLHMLLLVPAAGFLMPRLPTPFAIFAIATVTFLGSSLLTMLYRVLKGLGRRAPLLAAAIFAVGVSEAASPQNQQRIGEIMKMLDDEPGFPQVRIDRREFWDKAPDEWIRDAEQIVKKGVSAMDFSHYTEVKSNVGQVGKEVEFLFRAECKENRGRFLPAIFTCIDNLCNARTWVNPYHDRWAFGNYYGKYRSIELNCSEIAFKLAMGLDWLKGKIPPDRVNRALAALQLHIIQPYLHSARTADYTHHGWFLGDSNWNVACHWQSCCVALSVIRDKRIRAEFIEAAERAAPYYLKTFSNEGYCAEGLDYWNYGYAEFMRLTHLLHVATHGQVDLSKLPKAKVGCFAPYEFQLANRCAPQFNDGGASVPNDTTLYYGEFFWPEVQTDYTNGLSPFKLWWCGYALIGMHGLDAWWPLRTGGKQYKLPIRTFFQDAQILLVRPFQENTNTVAACLKGGNNGVPHNHNDIGQFVISIGSTQLVQDPADKAYDLETFTEKRYNHPMLNSYGHAVPVIDGTLQAAGEKHASKVLRTNFTDERDSITLDLAGAYTNSILKRLERTLVYDREHGRVGIADVAEYNRPGRFETAISTYGRIENRGENKFVIVRQTKNGEKRLAFTVDTQGAKWHVKEEKIPNPKRTEPTRWAVVIDEPAKKFTVRFAFRRD